MTFACLTVSEAPRLRTQRVGATTYFLAEVDAPKDLALPEPATRVSPDHLEDFFFAGPSERARRAVVEVPRLVPLDGRNASVHFAEAHGARLVFVGKGPAAFFRLSDTGTNRKAKGFAALPGDRGERYVGLELVWADAKPVDLPERKRGTRRYPAADDLQGRHAWAQAMWFARMELCASQAGLFGVARHLTGPNTASGPTRSTAPSRRELPRHRTRSRCSPGPHTLTRP